MLLLKNRFGGDVTSVARRPHHTYDASRLSHAARTHSHCFVCISGLLDLWLGIAPRRRTGHRAAGVHVRAARLLRSGMTSGNAIHRVGTVRTDRLLVAFR